MSDKAIQNRATDGVLWILWEVFYRGTDLIMSGESFHPSVIGGLLRTKNKSKTLCSAPLHLQRWSVGMKASHMCRSARAQA